MQQILLSIQKNHLDGRLLPFSYIGGSKLMGMMIIQLTPLFKNYPRIAPTSMEERVDKRLYQMFFVWFSANFNILAFSTGTAAPAFFNLGLRDSILISIIADTMYVPSTKFIVSTNPLSPLEHVPFQPSCT
jgi:hypothetical protein